MTLSSITQLDRTEPRLHDAVRDGPVVLEAHDSGPDVVVTVHNRGLPIAVESQEAIFEPLVRRAPGATGDAHDSGIGLGLFIARAIVASHEGKISVTSSEKEGTTMTVRLPRKPAPASS